MINLIYFSGTSNLAGAHVDCLMWKCCTLDIKIISYCKLDQKQSILVTMFMEGMLASYFMSAFFPSYFGVKVPHNY